MNRRSDPLQIDQALVTRILLGALSEHEQRRLVVRLLHRDPDLRIQLIGLIEAFEMFDLDLLAEYASTLSRHRGNGGDDPAALKRRRQSILRRAFSRAGNLEELISTFTFGDVLRLGTSARQFFTWSMAEFLLVRGQRRQATVYHAKTSLYLAMMVIDTVEILGAAEHSPLFPEVIADVRRRILAASALLEET